MSLTFTSCPAATQLALLLLGYDAARWELGEAIQEAIEKQFADWPDEKKADLYARLAERVEPGMRYFAMRDAVLDCINDNAEVYR